MYHFDQKISMQTEAYSIYFLTENSENFDLLESTFGDLYGDWETGRLVLYPWELRIIQGSW